MSTRVQKWGNSLGVRIPKACAEEAGLQSGAEVEISVEEGVLVVRPTRASYRLADLVERITPRNRHDEIDTGDSVGREVW